MMADVSAVMVPVSLSCDHTLLMSCDLMSCDFMSCDHMTTCHVTMHAYVI